MSPLSFIYVWNHGLHPTMKVTVTEINSPTVVLYLPYEFYSIELPQINVSLINLSITTSSWCSLSRFQSLDHGECDITEDTTFLVPSLVNDLRSPSYNILKPTKTFSLWTSVSPSTSLFVWPKWKEGGH